MLCLKRAQSLTTLSSPPPCTYSPCLLLLSQLLPYFPTAPFRERRCTRTGLGVRAEILPSSSLKDSPLAFFPHISFYLCQQFSSVKSTYQTQQNLLTMQNPLHIGSSLSWRDLTISQQDLPMFYLKVCPLSGKSSLCHLPNQQNL